jgi:hypothetical protein
LQKRLRVPLLIRLPVNALSEHILPGVLPDAH